MGPAHFGGTTVGGATDRAARMGDAMNSEDGLRGRKKQRTRDQLIQAAIVVCREKGFEDTTVREIVDTADVSLRTFSRYFPTKESVILAVVDDCARFAAARVYEARREASPLEALFTAHITMLTEMTKGNGPVDPPTLAATVGIVGASPILRRQLAGFHSAELAQAVADRLGTDPTDRSALLILTVWIAVVVNAFHDPLSWVPMGWQTNESVPALMAKRIEESYAELMRQLTPAAAALAIR